MTPREQARSQRLSQRRFQRPSGSAQKGLSRRLRPLALAATLGVLAVALSGCSWSQALGMGWPEGITPQAHLNRELWIGAVIASLVVGVIVWGLIFWSAAFHRKKATDTELPRQFGYNMPLELVLTVTPFLIISVLFYFTVVVQEKMLHLAKDPEVVIDVTSFQWNWKFGYQRVNFKDGTLTYDGADAARKKAMVSKPEGKDAHGEELVGPVRGLNTEDRTYLNFDKVETLGTSTEIPVLVLPTGKRIEFQLASADVVHAFWVPEFLFKRDVMPNPVGEQLGQRLPGRRDQPDRGLRRALRRVVRHLSLDDELRGSSGATQRLQGLPAAADRRKEQRPGIAGDRPVPARGDHPPVRHPPRRDDAKPVG